MFREFLPGIAIRCLSAALLLPALCGSLRSETLFKLSDLSNEQRVDLFTQIDTFGAATAMLDYCQRPPNLVAQIVPIAEGCVDAASLSVVLDRYTTAVVENSGAYNCRAPGSATLIPEIEAKMAGIVASLRKACRLRSFYSISFPKINFP